MTKIKELRNKAQKTLKDAEAVRAEITDDMKPEEVRAKQDQFDTMMGEYDDLVKEADREERLYNAQQAEERRREDEERERRNRRPGGDDQTFDPVQDGGSDEYREAMRQLLANGGETDGLDPEVRSALRHGARELRAQTAGAGNQGGYLVPTTLAGFINVAMAAHGPMMDAGIATEIKLATGAPFDIPTVDDTGNEASARAEGSNGLDDGSGDVVLGKAQLLAYTMATPWIRWSFELAQDSSFGFEKLLGKLIGERLGRKGNRWLTVGSGNNEPLGFVTAAPVGKVATAANFVTFDNIMELEHSVDPAYRGGPKVRFQMHDNTVLALRKIKDTTGKYIWSDGDVTKGVPATLNSKPVSFNQAMDEIGADAKPIAFGDFSEYYVRKVGNPLLGLAKEKFFPDLGVMGVHRIDGAPGQAKAIKTLQMAAA